jgi:hypothetical protein
VTTESGRPAGSRQPSRSPSDPSDAPPESSHDGKVGVQGSAVEGCRKPVHFMAVDGPVMTPDVAAVLARIVRTLSERQKGKAA